jgi:hypothetical protein
MKKILIFGTGSGYEKIKRSINYNKIEIVAFTDNNNNLWNNNFEGSIILPPQEVIKLEYDYILIASSYYNAIESQLKEYKIDTSIIISYYNIDSWEAEQDKLIEIFETDIIVKGLYKLLREYKIKSDIAFEKNLILQAKMFINIIKRSQVNKIEEAEFKVFSQFGEDGIIQFIINKIPIPNKVFIEFGVENYIESNTRFLLVNNNWSGLVIDGDKENIEYIKNDSIYFNHNLKAVSNFITKDNINDIISSSEISGDIGLLSIDIDGNDYWIWETINVINPRIVICEYNSIFGNEKEVTIPYREDFVRKNAHYSLLFAGASLPALCSLAEKKGYDFIGSNSAGNNAFFIRKDLSNNFNVLSPMEGYVESKFRESRDKSGNLSYLSGTDRLIEISEMKLIDIESGQEVKIRDLYKL